MTFEVLANEHAIPEGVYVGSFAENVCGVLTVDYDDGHRYLAGNCTKERDGTTDAQFETAEVTIEPTASGAIIMVKAAKYDVIDVGRNGLTGQWTLSDYNNMVQVFRFVAELRNDAAEAEHAEEVTNPPPARSGIEGGGNEPQGPFFTDKDTIQAVQAALTVFGYAPGPADGIMGGRTKQAIREFRNDAAMPDGEQIDTALILALDIRGIGSPYIADIYVTTEPSQQLGKRLEALNREQVVAELERLAANDLKEIDLVFSKPKTIVFVIYSPVEFESMVRTYASHIVNGNQGGWHSDFNYYIGNDVPTEPLIIINYFETSNEMFLVHELFVGREKAASRLTRAH